MNCSNLQTIEIEDKYNIRNDVRQIYTHIYIYRQKNLQFTCVGLASAGPNNQNCSQKKEAVYFCSVLLITNCMRTEIKEDEKLLIDLKWP